MVRVLVHPGPQLSVGGTVEGGVHQALKPGMPHEQRILDPLDQGIGLVPMSFLLQRKNSPVQRRVMPGQQLRQPAHAALCGAGHAQRRRLDPRRRLCGRSSRHSQLLTPSTKATTAAIVLVYFTTSNSMFYLCHQGQAPYLLHLSTGFKPSRIDCSYGTAHTSTTRKMMDPLVWCLTNTVMKLRGHFGCRQGAMTCRGGFQTRPCGGHHARKSNAADGQKDPQIHNRICETPH